MVKQIGHFMEKGARGEGTYYVVTYLHITFCSCILALILIIRINLCIFIRAQDYWVQINLSFATVVHI